ncbi:Alpha/beta hydrolase OS=Streptomyces tendae OX=1932 GN=GUR47_14950 PE=3 SV=1 [Streptomyces tendae]
MKAPLDWDDPEGDTIGLALIRAEADGAADRRIGSLVFNFGGPGGSGVTTLPAFGQDYAKLRTRYDLVSFDPRGVGRSDPVQCLDDRAAGHLFPAGRHPRRPGRAHRAGGQHGEVQRGLREALEEDPSACAHDRRRPRHGPDAPGPRRREADYFGISYGTELGGVYAHLFPEHVGRAVFDAVVDPTQNAEQSSLGQAEGFQRALGRLRRGLVSKRPGTGPSGNGRRTSEARIAGLLKDLDRKPIPGVFPPRTHRDRPRPAAIAQALYSKDFWEHL